MNQRGIKPGSAISEATVAVDSATTVAYLTLAITFQSGKISGLQVVPAVQNLTGIGQPVLEPDLPDTSTICTNTEKRVVESPYLNAEEAAAYLGISKASLYGIVERAANSASAWTQADLSVHEGDA